MKSVLKICIPFVIIVFLFATVIQNWLLIYSKLVVADWRLLGIAGLLLLLTHFGGAYFWYKVLDSIRFKIAFKEAVRVFIVSNFGRFLPGVVLHYVARVYLVKNLGLSVKEGGASVALEIYYTLAGAVIISYLALPLLLEFAVFKEVIIFGAVGLFLTLLLLQPRLILRLIRIVPYFRQYASKLEISTDFSSHLYLLGISSILFLLDGIALFLISLAFDMSSWDLLLSLTGLFSTSWIVGFLTPVAPGGLGVSDISLAYLLTRYYQFSFASFLVIVFRLGLLITEGVAFLIVVYLFKGDVLFNERK